MNDDIAKGAYDGIYIWAELVDGIQHAIHAHVSQDGPFTTRQWLHLRDYCSDAYGDVLIAADTLCED